MAVGDPEVVEVGPAMFSIPKVDYVPILPSSSYC